MTEEWWAGEPTALPAPVLPCVCFGCRDMIHLHIGPKRSSRRLPPLRAKLRRRWRQARVRQVLHSAGKGWY